MQKIVSQRGTGPRATSSRNTGRHHVGMPGRLRRNPHWPTVSTISARSRNKFLASQLVSATTLARCTCASSVRASAVKRNNLRAMMPCASLLGREALQWIIVRVRGHSRHGRAALIDPWPGPETFIGEWEVTVAPRNASPIPLSRSSRRAPPASRRSTACQRKITDSSMICAGKPDQQVGFAAAAPPPYSIRSALLK